MPEPATNMPMEPIRLSAMVRQPVREAFRIFTDRIGDWWPLQGFSYGRERAREIHLEPVAGGRFYERYTDGEEFDVGKVLVCEPPTRIVFSWQGDWKASTEVEIRFTPQGSVTRVDLEHRHWERLGAELGGHWRMSFQNGWPTVLGHYRRAAGMVEERA